MREILFRGKRTDNGAWVYGYYSPLLLPIFGNMGHFINQQGYNAVEVIPETVGQYTGLTDRNGKKIFEGDIVKIPLYESCQGQVIAVVAWDIKKAVFYLHGKRVKTDFYYYFGDDCEVIGNIHDNHELLLNEENGG